MKNNSKKKYLINFLLIIVIGAAVIYFTMKDDLEASIEALLTASAGWKRKKIHLLSFLPDTISAKTIFMN